MEYAVDTAVSRPFLRLSDNLCTVGPSSATNIGMNRIEEFKEFRNTIRS